MNLNNFDRINFNSEINQADIVRRIIQDKYEYYKVKEYDELNEKYVLESFSNLPESAGFYITATAIELINNFEKLYL